MMDHDASTNAPWTMDKVLLKPGIVVEILNNFARRERDLLEANNRYLERARKAEVASLSQHELDNAYNKACFDVDNAITAALRNYFSCGESAKLRDELIDICCQAIDSSTVAHFGDRYPAFQKKLIAGEFGERRSSEVQ